jgi:hypothetical protein
LGSFDVEHVGCGFDCGSEIWRIRQNYSFPTTKGRQAAGRKDA